MTSDEEINVVIQSLQDQIKYGQEVNSEVSTILGKNKHDYTKKNKKFGSS